MRHLFFVHLNTCSFTLCGCYDEVRVFCYQHVVIFAFRLHINVQKLHHIELFCTSVLCDTGSELAPVSQWHHCVRVGEVMCCCRYNFFPPRLSPQVDEEAPMRGSWPNRGCVQIKCQETTVRPHGTEVATQTYHIQVGGFSFSFVFKAFQCYLALQHVQKTPETHPKLRGDPNHPSSRVGDIEIGRKNTFFLSSSFISESFELLTCPCL